MSSKYIDITYPISGNLPKWPNSIGYKTNWVLSMPESTNNLSSFTTDTHFGTHLDAPLHFIHQGKSIPEISFDKLIGKCYVLELRAIRSITSKDLEQAEIPLNCEKILLKTDNQFYWEQEIQDFQEDFCSIDSTGAQWIVDRGIHLIGIDYLSIQRYHDGPETHQILLNNEVVIVETLNLEAVSTGWFNLICLPINLKNLEGAPVRAILEEI